MGVGANGSRFLGLCFKRCALGTASVPLRYHFVPSGTLTVQSDPAPMDVHLVDGGPSPMDFQNKKQGLFFL